MIISEKLSVPSPTNGDVELLFGLVAKIGLQLVMEKIPSHPPIVIVAERFIDPGDNRQSQNPAGDDCFARQNGSIGVCASKRGEQQISFMQRDETQQISCLHNGQEVIELENQVAAHTVEIDPSIFLH